MTNLLKGLYDKVPRLKAFSLKDMLWPAQKLTGDLPLLQHEKVQVADDCQDL